VIEVATDGCCKGNPGPGGWGYVIKDGGGVCNSYYGGEENTTNNRMELKAFIEAVEALGTLDEDVPVTIYLDSQYVLKGATEWLKGWILKDWKTSQKKPVENKDLWQQVASLRPIWRNFDFVWVKGHDGHDLNEMADAAANKGFAEVVLGDW